MRLAALAKGGYYPTPPRVVDLVAKLLYGARGRARSADTLRILDPCCGAGDALAQFAELLQGPQHCGRGDLRGGTAPGPGGTGDGCPGPDAGLRPLRHHHRQQRLRRGCF